jgi:hypothetical protein
MLQVRDRLLEVEPLLSTQKKDQLSQADRRLIQQAPQVFLEFSQFVDLAAQRRIQDIPAARWWRYLDVLAQIQQDSQLSSIMI